jgi:hypothetical protein
MLWMLGDVDVAANWSFSEAIRMTGVCDHTRDPANCCKGASGRRKSVPSILSIPTAIVIYRRCGVGVSYDWEGHEA